MTHTFLFGDGGRKPACCLSICVLREAEMEPWAPDALSGVEQVLNVVLGQVFRCDR